MRCSHCLEHFQHFPSLPPWSLAPPGWELRVIRRQDRALTDIPPDLPGAKVCPCKLETPRPSVLDDQHDSPSVVRRAFDLPFENCFGMERVHARWEWRTNKLRVRAGRAAPWNPCKAFAACFLILKSYCTKY